MVRRKGPRDLRPDERALWRQVKETARPLRPAPVERAPPVPPEPASSRTPVDLGRLSIGPQDAPAISPKPVLPPGRTASSAPRMDAKAFARMRRGKLAIEGRIDLHGLTVDEAHPRLAGFVLRAHSAGKRLVLVITGKGRPDGADGPMPAHRGILRRQVPVWLRSGALAGLVLEIREAHRNHGGAGAYYVYLRRNAQ